MGFIDRLLYVRFPTSGLCWEIGEARRPKFMFWDKFKQVSVAPTIHFLDHETLQYKLADGSHLDKSQKSTFTVSLYKIINEFL